MKNVSQKKSCKLELEIILIFIFLATITTAQTKISTIDGAYVERTTHNCANLTECDSAKVAEETHFFKITETSIKDGDVIAFDIPGFNDFVSENKRSLKNVVLKIDDVELEEFPAYLESTDTDVVRFKFVTHKLSKEDRKSLYKLSGTSTKKVMLGIKFDETNIIYYNESACLYFHEIKTWGSFGWVLIVFFFGFFALLVLTNNTMLKDSLDDVLDKEGKVPCYSFSKSQFAFWTFIVISSFIYIWGFTDDIQSINTTALILLGITTATISTSNLITKSSNADSKAASYAKFRDANDTSKSNFFKDILSDKNGMSIQRLQAVAFNIIFGIAFFKEVIIDYTMPEFSNTQLMLLGLSNGTYAFLKKSENK